MCLSGGFGRCMVQPAIICQECTVADDIPWRAEDCTFSVVIRLRLGDPDCTAQYNCCLPATTVGASVLFVLFNFVQCHCNVFDMVVSP